MLSPRVSGCNSGFNHVSRLWNDTLVGLFGKYLVIRSLIITSDRCMIVLSTYPSHMTIKICLTCPSSYVFDYPNTCRCLLALPCIYTKKNKFFHAFGIQCQNKNVYFIITVVHCISILFVLVSKSKVWTTSRFPAHACSWVLRQTSEQMQACL